MNIYLIGMPLSGKSTLGRKLSEKLKYNFLDIDSYIKKKANCSISEIFANYGEEYFRQMETSCLKKISKSFRNTVISCGGGIVVKEENKKYLDGIVIYINVKLEELNKRLVDDDTRPILKNNNLESLYSQRKDKYFNFSHYTVNHDNTLDNLKQIIEILNKHSLLTT